jgi:hypothetical protein
MREKLGCIYFWFYEHFLLKVGVEESILNAPLFSLQNKNTNNAKSEVSFKQVIRNPWCVHNRLFNASFEDKFKMNT